MRWLLIVLLSFSSVADAQSEETAEQSEEAEEIDPETAQQRDEEARMLFEAGRRAFGDGRFEEALQHYQRAHELSGRPALLFNIASAHDRLGHLDEAVESYQAFLEAVPDSEQRPFVESRLEVLRGLIVERDSGREAERRRQELEARERERLANRRSLAGPITLVAVGGAAAISALGTGLRANGLYDELDSDCPERMCPDSRRDDGDRLDRLALVTDLLLLTAVGLATAGVLWWVLGGDSDSDSSSSEVEAGAACAGDGCIASARLRF